jgi:hypothetical protein
MPLGKLALLGTTGVAQQGQCVRWGRPKIHRGISWSHSVDRGISRTAGDRAAGCGRRCRRRAITTGAEPRVELPTADADPPLMGADACAWSSEPKSSSDRIKQRRVPVREGAEPSANLRGVVLTRQIDAIRAS